MNSNNKFANLAKATDRPPLQSKRLLDQMRERLRYMHYSLNTEKTYVSDRCRRSLRYSPSFATLVDFNDEDCHDRNTPSAHRTRPPRH
ncbi:MAG: hypothetical protein CFE43_14285 [Burkholderiales bacterium PBB3]|nr:MAG: hypothetical protein CFE43_14285 [Burkholderiales bacterium PBB3]